MIINKTQNKTVSKKEKYCTTLLSKSIGLMFRKKQNLIMILNKEKKARLHNFFVFYPIDVLILDRNKKIVETKKDFKPFTFWNSKKKGKYVVELGIKGNYKINDILSFKN